MDFLIEKYNSWTKNPQNGENLFFTGFIIYMFWSIMRTTMFPHSGMAFNMCLVLSVVILVMKIFLFDVYTFKMFIAVAGMFACSAIVLVSSGYFWPFLWVLMIVSAKDVPFRKILQIYLLMNISIMGLAFIASLLGVIENLAYTSADLGKGMYRYSFGCVYTTDFAAHIFFMLLTAFYLYQEKLRWYHYIGTCVISGLIYYFCYAKLDTICIFLLGLFFAGYHVLQWQSKREKQQIFIFKRTKANIRWKKIWNVFALVSMVFFGMVMYFLSFYYEEDNEFIETINETITGRLDLAKIGLEKYGITLFGQNIPMIGMGGSTKSPKDYFFIDSSYLFILLRYGILFFVMVIVIYGLICYKNREDTVLMMLVVLLAISCSIDHHLLDEAYNPLSYALFAKAGSMAWGKGTELKLYQMWAGSCLYRR